MQCIYEWPWFSAKNDAFKWNQWGNSPEKQHNGDVATKQRKHMETCPHHLSCIHWGCVLIFCVCLRGRDIATDIWLFCAEDLNLYLPKRRVSCHHTGEVLSISGVHSDLTPSYLMCLQLMRNIRNIRNIWRFPQMGLPHYPISSKLGPFRIETHGFGD